MKRERSPTPRRNAIGRPLPWGDALSGCLAIFGLLLDCGSWGKRALGDSEAADHPPVRRVLRAEITPDLRFAVERGFDFLLRQQLPSGSMENEEYPVANNSLAGLAFLAGGHTPRTGPYAKPLQKLIDYLLSSQSENGYFADQSSRMYGHGFATLFMAQLCGMTGQQDARIRAALKRAIDLIERSQSADGGWDYEPGGLRLFTGDASASDTSITVCETLALRAAKSAGITVDRSVIARAKAFIQKAQNANGGFAYRIGKRFSFLTSESAFPRSAAGVCILISLGEYNTPAIAKGFEYLKRNYRDFSEFPFYADYYCAQAMFQAGGGYWEDYFRYLKEKLLRQQKANGCWKGDKGGPIQSTAMALIALQIPYQYLPIIER